MLQEFVSSPHPAPGKELGSRLSQRKAQLAGQLQRIKAARLPVLVLFEGWGGAGKGRLIGRAIQQIDPRFFKVYSMPAPTAEEQRKPFLWRYFNVIPEAGKFVFLDSGWLDETVRARLEGGLEGEEYAARLESINTFERQLTAGGYLLVKIFLQIGRKEQKKRLGRLADDKDTAWRVDGYDAWQAKHYKTCFAAFDSALEATNTAYAPWHIVDAEQKKAAELAVYTLITDSIEAALATRPGLGLIAQRQFPLRPMPLLANVPLDKTLTDKEYSAHLKALQAQLGELHNRLYRKKVPVVIGYEGWDAAGKGGNIKRLTAALDPRGYEVIPIASPEPHELARHYLWRFWRALPKTGHIAIFDRTWYGRVMVERLEGFCSEEDWKRAYNEINEFEKELTDWGAVVLKFWVQIDKDTQLARFTERQNTPEKRWKITDEDWRNREKWDAYEQAVNEMLQKTSTANAPWHIIESVDKKYARVKALGIVVEALEKALK